MSIGSIAARIAALLGGAIAGAFLAEWLDRQLSEQAQTRSEQDRTRYAQGLAPRVIQPAPGEKRYEEKPYREE